MNGNRATAFRYNLLLTGIELPPGNNQVELVFDPTGLRLGFFLLFTFFGVFSFFLIRGLLA